MVRFPMLIHRKKTGLMVSLESVVLVCVAWQIMILQELSCICQIVVVKDGSIEAQGRHEELLRHCPLYADLWQAHMGVKEGETV